LFANYFIAVRVSNPAIHSTIKEIQDSILSKRPLLQPAAIPLGTLHITLMVMHLEKEQLPKAVDILQSCQSDLKKVFEENHFQDLTFEGLGHFRNEVVFGKIKNESEVTMLQSLASVVRQGYESDDEIQLQMEDRPLTPHLTIMKLSRMPVKKKKKNVRKIQSDMYSSWIDCQLGLETLSEVLLCSMIDKKEEDGFYRHIAQLFHSHLLYQDSVLVGQESSEFRQVWENLLARRVVLRH